MTHIVLSIGSNINRESNIRFAICQLRKNYHKIEISPVYNTVAVGFCGPKFLNVVVGFWSDIDYVQLCEELRAIEFQAGRVREYKSNNSRTLDIDILLFGDANLRPQQIDIPRAEIEHYAFVLKPLSDLYPELRHPISGLSYFEMMAMFGSADEQLEQIVFDFDGVV